ncbi:MAG: sodium:proton antiporter NhaD, partial [Bacteroidales bacterium]|nr:sodium:proton antiporter NhaD [Bacteroidales bacterium]
ALNENLAETAQTLFFLFAAMTIVEIVDRHNGFKIITDRITATSKVKLLWILSFLTFFMSAVLDNLTTTIVILSLLRKLINDQHTRWTYASIVVIAANAGGAWSPIGDVTTIMLWIGGQITAAKIITGIILPSLVSMIVPLIILSFTLKGEIERPEESEEAESITTPGEQMALLILGVGLLLFVPVFKTITHLPPYMGMLLGLGVMWMVTELMHKKKSWEIKKRLTVVHILKHVETPTIFFFLGILTAVGALGAAGQLGKLSVWLREVTGGNIYVIDTVIGVLSSIIDNVPLVAASMKMYLIDPSVADFAVDGTFWHMLAYCAGTGGSILIIGSAAGVAAMGLEKIDFIWYLKHISWLALVGYLAGAFCIYLGL